MSVTAHSDAFHVVRLGLDALDWVRRRVQQQTLGHRGHRDDPLFRIRRLLRRGHEHHTERSWARLLAGLEAGDDDQQIGRAWIAAQELRLLYRERDRPHAERRLLRWFTDIADHEIPELLRLACTLDAWRDELLAYFDTGGVSNGPTEAINGLIKKIKRVGHGYRNFANYRLRLLLHRCSAPPRRARSLPRVEVIEVPGPGRQVPQLPGSRPAPATPTGESPRAQRPVRRRPRPIPEPLPRIGRDSVSTPDHGITSAEATRK